jgi:trimeric autotransporter adhesin
MNTLTQFKDATIFPVLIALTLGCFGLAPKARAACQEGCLTNFNTVLGEDALFSNTSGAFCTAIGFNALFSNTSGNSNTANGYQALFFNTTGVGNTAAGEQALFSNATGGENTANGFQTLLNNTTGGENTAVGSRALANNTTGTSNTATGDQALVSNTIGTKNTANGGGALLFNTTGSNNTANGFEALDSNTTGVENTANGSTALLLNTTGNNNTALGDGALKNNSTGSSNIAIGADAGLNLTTGNSNIDIGNAGVAGESRVIRIGKQGTQRTTFIAGISGAIVPTGVAVIVDANGHLGTTTSSARFKEAIRPMDKASETILDLKPVTFHYKKEFDADGIPQFGLVAEEVEKVNSDLVARDEEGKPYTVRYEAVNAMLLNEFLKEHRKVEEQSSQIARQDCKVQKLEATVVQLQSALKEQAAQIRKVSDQLSATEPAARLVTNQ